MEYIVSELPNRFQNSLGFFDKTHQIFLEKQQSIIQTQTNWSHRLDQALRKRISHLMTKYHPSSKRHPSSPSPPLPVSLSIPIPITNLLEIKHRVLLESRHHLHSISDYEQALEKFDFYLQQQQLH
jgi:hypothetical protein